VYSFANRITAWSHLFGAYGHADARTYDPNNASSIFTDFEYVRFIKQCKEAKAGFVASLMPTYGYAGFQANDTKQAVAVAKSLKKFTDAGIETYLRWGHEMSECILAGCGLS
jgi:hypothetical protein